MLQNYEIIQELKHNVYLVKNLKHEYLIIKKFPKNVNEYTSIYLHEIETLKKLQHPNIIKIEKIEEDSNSHYVFFKYIDGYTFENKFNSLASSQSHCSFFKSLIKIVETIDYIHAHNYTHGDIKPSNILIDHNGEPYILDFGTATIENSITKTQQDLSLWYASPEQKNNREIDNTTDLYSLGISILEVLTKEKFDLFKSNQISVDQLIDDVTLFDDGINEELKNILRRLTYQDRTQRIQRAKDVINNFSNILNLYDCYGTYELNIIDKIKPQLQEEFDLKSWNILQFLQEKIDNSLKYIQFDRDDEGKERIQIATDDLLYKCGYNERNFYIFGYSKRVPDSIKQNGHIIEDRFFLTDGRPKETYNHTHGLIDKLERLEKDQKKEKDTYEKKKNFLDKTNAQLKIERAILDQKNISMYGKKIEHKKGKRELTIERINISNIEISEKHLKIKAHEHEKFIHELFNDGFIDDPNSQNVVSTLNDLIESYFFEKYRKEIGKKLFEGLSAEKQKSSSQKGIEQLLLSKYQEKTTSFEKLIFNVQRLFDMYPLYLLKQKEENKAFTMNDDVIVEGIEKNNEFHEKFTVSQINQARNQIVLNHEKELGKVPNELKVFFDYDRSSAVLKKQEYSIRDLKENKAVMENLLGKISNPKTLAPKKEIPRCVTYFNHEMDENQQSAVDKALSLELGEYLLIQGPPGTGKTTVITEIIKQILSKNKLAKILVTSQSNQAVDNVLEKIIESEEKIVRFGNDKSKLSVIAKCYHEEAVFDKFLQETKRRLDEDKTNYFLQNECLDALHEKWKQQILQADEELQTLLFKKIRVIFGTLVGISSWNDFRNIEFDYIIVDEAGRATLPELMIPLRKAKRFILVGDHKQLPPIVDDIVLSQMEGYKKEDLEATLFEELYNKIEAQDFRHFLKYNYRSDRNIAKIYSETFYGGEIETKEFLKREHNLAFAKKVYFYSTSKLDNRFDSQAGTGKKNDCSKEVILQLLEDIQTQAQAKNIKKSIGIITPYLAQRDNIKSQLGQKKKAYDMLNIDVNSVDAFQGSDRDIIIYDIVRSQQDNKTNIEFVADEKRLNVALSRTKELLFIVGDADFIYDAPVKEKDNPFKKIIEILNQDSKNYEIKELR
ncbi:MAG: AAA domain-containing protein [Sulfurovum sp.]|nr:AAA domain-containing protein [Sulfurovum sp.]